MANAVNEALIRDVIQDVLGRLGGEAPVAPAAGEDKLSLIHISEPTRPY